MQNRFAGGVVGIVFGGVGVTVLVFMWSQPSGQFGSPPLFFRVFASFIALGFVAFGVAGLGTLFGLGGNSSRASSYPRSRRLYQNHRNDQPSRASNWDCPNCGSALTDDNEISPSGDVKCLHCDSWYNVDR